MPQPNKIESLDDVKAWIYNRNGRDDAWWDAQHSWNIKVEKEMRSLGLRISTCEKKLMMIAGAASAFGGLVGGLLAQWFGG